MIRLVTQFDSPRRRASAASPKSSGCCCCCCCCIVTTIATGVVTARAVGGGRRVIDVPEAALGTSASPAAGSDELLRPRRLWPWRLLAFFLLPLAVTLAFVAAFGAGSGNVWFGVFTVVLLFLYVGGLLTIRHFAGLRWRWFPILLLGVPVVTALEIYAWFAVVFK